jgi:pimeloyl-ACP methyl ester carboxylesterase
MRATYAGGVTLLAHERHGSGPRPLLLLHGFLGSARNVASLARALAGRDARWSVVALDLPGHGASPPLPPGADLAALARAVLDSARALAPPPPYTIVGHSLGGRVGLRAGILEPGALAHVTLLDISPTGRPPGAETSRMVEALVAAPETAPDRHAVRRHFLAAGLDAGVADWLILNLERRGERYRWRIDRAALAALHPRITGEDLWAAVEGGRPYTVHCVRAGRSGYVPDADARRLVAAGCPVATVEGAGHFLHAERSAETLERVREGLG